MGFATRIAHNVCVDYFRKVKRVQVVNAGDSTEFFEVYNTPDNTAEDQMVQFETSERLRILLNQLPQDQKEVIVLRHFADFSFKEISELTNCSINTALGRMRYGLTNLRKMLIENRIAL